MHGKVSLTPRTHDRDLKLGVQGIRYVVDVDPVVASHESVVALKGKVGVGIGD